MEKLHVKTIIEIAGLPKEHVEEVMNKVVDKTKENYEVIKFNIFEAKPMKQLWSTFSEIEIKFNKLEDLIGFCFDYMPSSVEILNPEKFEFKNVEMTNVLNDLIARLHQFDRVIKSLTASNVNLKKELDKEKY